MERSVEFFATIYRFLLLLPIEKPSRMPFVRSRTLTFFTFFFLLYFWIGLLISWITQEIKTNLITKTANTIQLLVNSVALTVILLNPSVRLSHIQAILQSIYSLNMRLLSNKIILNSVKNRRNALIFFLIPTIFLLYFNIFDAIYTFSVQKILGILYWLITIYPLNFILLTNIQICLILLLIRLILTQCTDVLHREIFTPPVQIVRPNGQNEDKPSFIPGIFYILTDVMDLCGLVDVYFGPIFLVTFATVFVTCSIQFYYVYIVLTAENPWDSLKTLSFVVSINLIVPNLILSATVTWLCQSIRNISRRNIVLIQKLQNRGSSNLLPAEIQKIIATQPYCTNEITFSAMDFFKVDLNMLTGMFGAILTYLVIFIQFSNIYGVTYEMGHLTKQLGNVIAPKF